jgi:Flp pilus assembly protein TadD
LDPRITSARLVLGTREPIDADRVQRWIRGETALGEALALDAELITQLREHALVLLEAGKYRESRAVLEMLIGLGDDDFSLLFLLAACCDLLGDRTTAEHYFGRALALSRDADDVELREAALIWGAHLVGDHEEEAP